MGGRSRCRVSRILIPFPHAKALERTIPNAKLIVLEGRGHEIHPKDWDPMIEEIIKHTVSRT
jgi:pimeloyl-ACP methyl ester carboxylesterase